MVDPPVRHGRLPQGGVRLHGEPLPPAHVHVVPGDVRQDPAQHSGGDRRPPDVRPVDRVQELRPRSSAMASSSSRRARSSAVRARYSSVRSRPAPGSVSNSARSGVMPAPPAISSTVPRLRRAAVRDPYGPSAHTRVPGRSPARAAPCPPTALTVIRGRSGRGGAEGEYGRAVQRSPFVRKRQRKNRPYRSQHAMPEEQHADHSVQHVPGGAGGPIGDELHPRGELVPEGEARAPYPPARRRAPVTPDSAPTSRAARTRRHSPHFM